MFSRKHLSRDDLFHLYDQLFLIQVWFFHILQQDSHHSAGIKPQHHFQIIHAQVKLRNLTARYLRQIYGYRLDKLSPVFAAEELEIRTVVVGILSARGRDLMEVQGRQVECEYFIPNLHYWVTESLLYPFLGGDSVGTPAPGRMLPSINLILPYYYPRHYVGTTDAAIRDLSRTALENTLSILHALEQAHQEQFSTALTLRRLGEALYRPRLPDRGRSLRYDLSLPASACLEDDLLRLDRIRMRGGMIHGA